MLLPRGLAPQGEEHSYQCAIVCPLPYGQGDPLYSGGSSALLEMGGRGVMQDLISDVGQLAFA